MSAAPAAPAAAPATLAAALVGDLHGQLPGLGPQRGRQGQVPGGQLPRPDAGGLAGAGGCFFLSGSEGRGLPSLLMWLSAAAMVPLLGRT